MRRLLPLLGPALVAGVAYLDPGNVAANMTAGARYGYLLVWVVILGNLIAWLVQYLSAKLGLATGRSLPQLIGKRTHNPWLRRAYWAQAEIVAIATDVAEVIGGAVALQLLFGLPLVLGGLITATVSLGILMVQNRSSARIFEWVIIALLVVISVGFGIGVIAAPPSAAGFFGGLVPRFTDIGSVLLATSILGATIMPHAIYAHSALTRDRFGSVDAGPARTRILRATRVDVTVALVVAGTVNLAMILVGATVLGGFAGDLSLNQIYISLGALLGPTIAFLFALGLLASGLASTSVGAYAGAEVMSGLLNIRIPLIARRAITVIPAVIILGFGINPLWALIFSQVVLSFGIPFALIPLIHFTRQSTIMGGEVNRRVTTGLAIAAATIVTALNITLVIITLGQALGQTIPGL
jgi:manganese transport protein